MGYVVFEEVLVSGFHKHIVLEHKKAKNIFKELVSEINENMNNYSSFVIFPFTSQCSWNEKERHTKKLEEYCKQIKNVEFVYIMWGADYGFDCKPYIKMTNAYHGD